MQSKVTEVENSKFQVAKNWYNGDTNTVPSSQFPRLNHISHVRKAKLATRTSRERSMLELSKYVRIASFAFHTREISFNLGK